MSVSVSEVCARHLEWAETYYSLSFRRGLRAAWSHLWAVVEPSMAAADMDCPMLWRYQQHLAGKRFTRRTVNLRVSQIQHAFHWASHPARGLVPLPVRQELDMLEPLKPLRSEAVESEPVQAVPLELAERTAALCSDQVATMIRVAWWSGMRPGEVCAMRWSAIDTADAPWLYHVRDHKNRWRRLERLVTIGPRCIMLLRRWCHGREGDVIFPGRNGEPMKATSFTIHIERVIKRHGLTSWFPHQLRHSYAERLALETTEQDAMVMLDHRDIATTRMYIGIDPNLPRKRELAMRFG